MATEYPGVLTDEGMESLIRTYFDGCNEADIEKMMACFEDDAVHYFPPGMYEGPFRGAKTIAEKWAAAVKKLGSVWTIDQVLTEARSGRAVIEWTHFKTFQGTMLRGDEWYAFDPSTGRIKEIRAYYASPQDQTLAVLELGGFDYKGRRYALEAPLSRTWSGSGPLEPRSHGGIAEDRKEGVDRGQPERDRGPRMGAVPGMGMDLGGR